MRVAVAFFAMLISAAVALASSGCSSSTDRREYILQGQVLSLTSDRREATIKHEDIKGLMPAMTMAYHVRDQKEFEGLAPGDLITATLVLVSNDGYLTNVRKVGSAPLEKPAAGSPEASSGSQPLRDGQPIPNAQ